jgi:DNA-binding winged helix-turn-helix (wHTH) protein/tetratricopeptide (TPR) repeat protein
MPSRATSNRLKRISAKRGDFQVKFLDFTADLRSGELFHKDEKVRLQEKPFQILALLLSRPGEVITKEEIWAAVWPNSHTFGNASVSTAIRKLRAALGDVPHNSRIVQTVGTRGYRMLAKPERAVTDVADKPIRLEVTPFRNLSGSEHAYFAEWLTEQMIVQLADPQADIRVIVPVQARLRDQNAGTKDEVALAPDADYVMRGTTRQVGGSLRVKAELTRVADRTCVWSETYSRQAGDVFRTQDEITLQIACSILRVLPRGVALQEEQSTTPEVYGKTQKGRHFAEKWNEPAFERAVTFFEQAIAEDPSFARAHAALARTHASMLQYGFGEPSFNQQRVRTEAAKALELCPDLPEAIVALGCAQLFYDADWAGAEASFKHALMVSPGSAYACESYARLLIATGRHEEAVAAASRARELNPLSPYSNIVVGAAFCFGRKFEKAIRPCTECIDMEPGFAMARAILGRAYEGLGRYDEAIESYREALRCAPGSAFILANLAGGLGVAGQRDEARQLLAKVLSMRQAGYVPGSWIAMCYISLGENEAGIEWLRTAVRERCGWRVLAVVDPRLDAIRREPAFQEVLKQIGFPQYEKSPR